MSRRAEILHRLNKDDRVYLSEKFKEKDARISDLEAKLAESEEKCNKQWLEIQAETHQIQMLEQDIKRIKKGYKNLEQQLAEKDEEIANLEFLYRAFKSVNPKNKLIEMINQDKISFAVEQLEKVKNEIYGSEVKIEEIEKLPIALNNYEIGYDKGRFKAINIIDNQSKQLKEGK